MDHISGNKFRGKDGASSGFCKVVTTTMKAKVRTLSTQGDTQRKVGFVSVKSPLMGTLQQHVPRDSHAFNRLIGEIHTEESISNEEALGRCAPATVTSASLVRLRRRTARGQSCGQKIREAGYSGRS
jgi:hypothetical protein